MAQRSDATAAEATQEACRRSSARNARVLLVLAALGWMLGVAVIYFLPAGATGLTEPHLQTPSPGAVRLGALARDLLHLLAALAIFLAAWGIGRWTLAVPALDRRLRLPLKARLESLLAAAGLGLGLMSLGALALAPIHLLRPVVLMFVVVLGVFAAAWRIPWRTVRKPRWRWGFDRFESVLLALLSLAGAFAVVGALAPEVEYDATWYHLDFAQRHLSAGTIVDDVCQYVSPYPWGTELLFAYGLALDGPIAAKLIHFGCGVLTALAVFALARRVAGRRAALLATTVFAVTPTVLWEATTAYIELATAFFVLLALTWVLKYVEQRSLSVLALAGMFLGFALSTKHLAVIAAVPLALIVIGASRGTLQRRLTAAGVLTVLAVLPALPWYVRAQVQAGNPVFPVLFEVFGADPRRWDAASDAGLERFNDRFGHGNGLLALLKLPWSTTMHAAAFGGSLGVAYLMSVPLAIHHRVPRQVLLIGLFCLGYLLLWASPISSLQLRFVVPALAPLAVLAGYGFDRALRAGWEWHRGVGLAATGLVVIVLGLSLPVFVRMHERDRSGYDGYLTHVLRETPVNVVSGAESEDAYLQRRIPSYAAVQRLNELAGPNDRVVVATDPYPDLYSEAPMLPDYAVCLRKAGMTGTGSSNYYRALRANSVDFVLVEDRLQNDSVVRWSDVQFERRYLTLEYSDDRARLYRVNAEPVN